MNASKAVTSIQTKALCVVAKGEARRKADDTSMPSAKSAGKADRASSGAPPAKALSGETVGIGVGDRVRPFRRLDVAGEIAGQSRSRTNAASIERHFARLRAEPATEIPGHPCPMPWDLSFLQSRSRGRSGIVRRPSI